MKITILAFATAKDVLGFSEKVVETVEGETPAELTARIAPGVEVRDWRVALDSEFASWDEPIGHARELAFLPPVSGG